MFHGYLSNLDDLLDTLTKSGRSKCTLGNPAGTCLKQAVLMMQLCQPSHPYLFVTCSLGFLRNMPLVCVLCSRVNVPCNCSEWGRGAGRRPCSRAAAAPVPLNPLLRPPHHALRASSASCQDGVCLVVRSLPTLALLACVRPCQRLLLLTLQGVYSFFIYDSNRRSVFAARDPSGREPLYYAMDEDEALRWPCGVTITLCRVCWESPASPLQAS